MVKVLSIDVGVRNLAYSIVTLNEDANHISVEAWGVIDLLDGGSRSSKNVCNGSGGNCNDNNDDSNPNNPNNKNKAPSPKQLRNFSEICRVLIQRLHHDISFVYDLSDISYVLIEDQPNYAGVTAIKAVQFYLQAFFEAEAFRNANGHPNVRMVKPNMKLKMCNVLSSDTRKHLQDTCTSKYRKTKQMAVQVSALFLQRSDPKLLSEFALLKKPDIADTLCQALSFLRDNSIQGRGVLMRTLPHVAWGDTTSDDPACS